MHAWVDESMRIGGAGGPGYYILAAVVGDPSDCEPLREQLIDLLQRGQRRLHWRDENQARRNLMAATLAELVFKAVVVVGTPVIKSKQERARRLCMETLLPALERIAVSRVWLEARTSALNQKDRRMVDALRGQKLVSPALRVDTARPREEPMLWASDIVAGAVNAARNGSNTRWLDALQHRITEYDIRLR